ncbi:MAG: hypothetical protein AAF716_02410 [Cyanobacteria bacterium P01_D01_bin.1]
MIFQTDAELKSAYAKRLQQAGQIVFVDKTISEHGGTIDILTDREIIFCTLTLDQASAFLLKSQIDFCSRFSPSWQKVVVVQNIDDPAAATFLAAAGIQLIETSAQLPQLSAGSVLAQPTEKPQALDRKAIYSYPALDSVAGGEGLRMAMMAIIAIVLVGGCGFVVSRMRSQRQPSSNLPSFSAILLPARV